jgi:hydrogenase nickel incorporation protein HypB
VISLSASTGEGFEAWLDWLLAGDHDHHATDALHARIAQLEAELAQAKAQISSQPAKA